MKSWIVKILVPVALVGHATVATAGGLDRVGTAGAQELRIPVGAAATSLGGATVALGGGLANMFFNPAALAGTDETQALVSYNTYLADSRVNYGAIASHLGTQGEIAFHAKVLNIGDITVTTETAPEGTGEILNPNFAVVGVTYARRMTDRVLLGIGGSFISEQVADATAQGFAVDLGVQYDTGWRGLRFGFAMKNIGPNMRYDGPDFEERLALRGGLQGQMPLKEEDRQSDYLYSYSYGAGFNFKLGDRPLHFDWAGTHAGEFFDDNQQFSLGITF